MIINGEKIGLIVSEIDISAVNSAAAWNAILLGAVGIFGLTSSADYMILPGKNELPDGSVIELYEFHIRDEEGRIDYASTLEVTAAAAAAVTSLCMALAFRNDVRDILGKFRRRP